MMDEYSRAINILAENVYELKQKQRYSSVQRRNQSVDMYGYELTGHGSASSPATLGISVSQDLIYYNRYEFQIVIENASATSFQILIDGIDLTPYFQSQFNGAWITGNGVYPNKGTAHYDVLLATGYMNEAEQNQILEPGYKEVQVVGNGDFDVKIINYMKYSHCNR